MARFEVSPTEADIIIQSLLKTIKDKDAEIEVIKSRYAPDVTAASLLRRFLVEKRPDITDELCDFIMNSKVHERHYSNLYDGALSALEYHRDSIDTPRLNDIINELEDLAGK